MRIAMEKSRNRKTDLNSTFYFGILFSLNIIFQNTILKNNFEAALIKKKYLSFPILMLCIVVLTIR